MGETTRRTRNQAAAEHYGPIAGQLFRNVVDLKALADRMEPDLRERVNEVCNGLVEGVDRVAGLENATLFERSSRRRSCT